MTKTFVITLPDDLDRALTTQAERLNKSPEEIMLQVLSEQLTNPSKLGDLKPTGTDPLLESIGSLSVDMTDLAENHDYYIGQALYRELNSVE
ncbi:MAG: hypothetical protein KME17_21595 [Cyanosarcina radialis HA8281-LM2]|jgi:hypothetical protein|nr:hypothetical protein [Cyanosarcina radialis HA8281-LM2]